MLILALLPAAAPLLLVRRRWHSTELLSMIPVASLALWCAATPIYWYCRSERYLLWWPAALALICGLVCLIRRRRVIIQSGSRDTAALIAGAFLAVPIMAVYFSNGPRMIDWEPGFVARHWIREDSFYLFALAQMSAVRQAYPHENPFLSGTPNCYPSLIQGALGAICRIDSRPAPIALWPYWIFPLIAVGPLMVHILSQFWTRSGIVTLLGLLFAFVLIRPDHLVFPQTQAFAFGFLLLLVWNLGRQPSQMILTRLVIAAGLLIILVFSHAVCSAAALAILAAVALHCALRKSPKHAAAYGGLALLGAALFAWMNKVPYPPPMSDIFPDKNAWALVASEFRPYWVVTLIILYSYDRRWLEGRHPRDSWSAIATFFLVAISVMYAAHGLTRASQFDRWFAIYNAPRFLVLALFFSLPQWMAVLPRIPPRSRYWRIAGLLLGIGGFLPQTARETILLVTGPPYVLDAEKLGMFTDIRNKTRPNQSILTNLPDYPVPTFTGRAQYVDKLAPFFTVGCVPENEVAKRLRDKEAIFSNQISQPMETWLCERNISALMLLKGPPAQLEKVPTGPKIKMLYDSGHASIADVTCK